MDIGRQSWCTYFLNFLLKKYLKYFLIWVHFNMLKYFLIGWTWGLSDGLRQRGCPTDVRIHEQPWLTGSGWVIVAADCRKRWYLLIQWVPGALSLRLPAWMVLPIGSKDASPFLRHDSSCFIVPVLLFSWAIQLLPHHSRPAGPCLNC
jgi:hypothetical protein